MSLEEFFKKKIESYRDDLEFRLESVILDLTESIVRRMKEKNISRSKLAEILGVSSPAITKILNGNSNFTLKTLLSLADSLDLNLKVDFHKKEGIPSADYELLNTASSTVPQDVMGQEPDEYSKRSDVTTTHSVSRQRVAWAALRADAA